MAFTSRCLITDPIFSTRGQRKALWFENCQVSSFVVDRSFIKYDGAINVFLQSLSENPTHLVNVQIQIQATKNVFCEYKSLSMHQKDFLLTFFRRYDIKIHLFVLVFYQKACICVMLKLLQIQTEINFRYRGKWAVRNRSRSLLYISFSLQGVHNFKIPQLHVRTSSNNCLMVSHTHTEGGKAGWRAGISPIDHVKLAAGTTVKADIGT